MGVLATIEPEWKGATRDLSDPFQQSDARWELDRAGADTLALAAWAARWARALLTAVDGAIDEEILAAAEEEVKDLEAETGQLQTDLEESKAEATDLRNAAKAAIADLEVLTVDLGKEAPLKRSDIITRLEPIRDVLEGAVG